MTTLIVTACDKPQQSTIAVTSNTTATNSRTVVPSTTGATNSPTILPPTTTATTNNKDVHEAQDCLKTLGYEPGPADGVMKQTTQHALELFQHEYMPDPITKKLDDPTMERLRSNAAAAILNKKTGPQARPGCGCPVEVSHPDGTRDCYQASGYLSPDGKTVIQPYQIQKDPATGEYVPSQ
jgi:hypothetical protein